MEFRFSFSSAVLVSGLLLIAGSCAPIDFYADAKINTAQKELDRLKGIQDNKNEDLQDLKGSSVIFFNANGGERIKAQNLENLRAQNLRLLRAMNFFGNVFLKEEVEKQMTDKEKYQSGIFSEVLYELSIPEKNFVALLLSKKMADYLLLFSTDDALAPNDQYYVKLVLFDLSSFSPIWVGTELRKVESQKQGLLEISKDLFFVLAQRLNKNRYQNRFQTLSEI